MHCEGEERPYAFLIQYQTVSCQLHAAIALSPDNRAPCTHWMRGSPRNYLDGLG
jgi:hypothetical protein